MRTTNHSLTWHSEHDLTVDMRRLRPLVKDLPPDIQQTIVQNFRDAFPDLIIDLTVKGDLRIEAK